MFSRKGLVATLLVYGAIFLWAVIERSWTFFGMVQLVSLALILWACGQGALRSWERGGFRRFLGVSLWVVPLMSCAWIATFYDSPMGPGVITMLMTGTTMAWSYVLPGLSSATPITILGALLLGLGVFRIVFQASWATCAGVSALTFHGATIWLLLVAYEDLPGGLTADDISAQKDVSHWVLKGDWDTARDLVLDSKEERAFAAFMSSNRGKNKKRNPGIAQIDLATGNVIGSLHSRMGDTIALDETTGLVWFSDFLDGHVRALDIESMTLTSQAYRVTPWPDGIASLLDGRIVARVETPRRSDPELFFIKPGQVQLESLQVDAHKWGNLNAAMEVVASRGEIFLLQTGDDATTLSLVSPERVIRQRVLPGIIWEASWDAATESLWLGSMTQDVVYKVDPQSFEYQTFEVPNGVREITALGNGWYAFADYLRSSVYLFDGEKIRRTIGVGRKPEAMALGPVSGNLYVLSDAGLTRIDTARIPAEL